MTNHRRFTAIAGFMLVMAFGVTAGQALEGEILNDSVMRFGPNGDYPRVGNVTKGTEVEINGCTGRGGWCVVIHDGRHGWVEQSNVLIQRISRPAKKFKDVIIVVNVDQFGYDYRRRGPGSRYDYDRRYRYNNRRGVGGRYDYNSFDYESDYRTDSRYRHDRLYGYDRPYGLRRYPPGNAVVPYVVQPDGAPDGKDLNVIPTDRVGGSTGGTTIRQRDFDVIKVR